MKKNNQNMSGMPAKTLTAKYDANGDYDQSTGNKATNNAQGSKKGSTANIKTSQYDANQDYTR